MDIEDEEDTCYNCGESFFTLNGYDCEYDCGEVFCSHACLADHAEGSMCEGNY